MTLAALTAVTFAAYLILAITIPASVPSYDATPGSIWANVLPFLASGAIALLLVARRPENRLGWLIGVLVISFVLSGISSIYLYRSLYAHDVPEQLLVPLTLGSGVLTTIFPAIAVLLPLLFPDGQLLSPRWRVVLWLTAAVTVVGAVTGVIDPGAIGDGHRQVLNPLGVAGGRDLLTAISGPGSTVLWIALMLAALVSLASRYRRASSDLRQQVKWFGVGTGLLVLGIVVASATAKSATWTTPVPIIASTIGFSAMPICIGVAVFKYRLYDINVVISRALVYGALALLITAMYVGIVVGIGSLIGSGGKPNLALSILATAVVAVGFQPVRERLQKVANRLVYGKRATPYEVLTEFSERVADSYAGDEVLPQMARVLAEGTGAEHATIWLRSAKHLNPAASHPDTIVDYEPLLIQDAGLPDFPDAPRAVAVRHQNELLGALTVSKRKGESLTPIEEKLLDDLARQAGLVLKNVGLTADLQARLEDLRASRQRLVAAQDDERRRLERNLHDGAQQHLVALKIKLGLAEALAVKDPAKARTTLLELKSDADEALQTLRDLARGIYPPLLADRGLPEALEAQARKATVAVSIEADGVGRYPQEVESAVYFCCLEALQNVQKYAAARTAIVTLRASKGHIQFQVSDDGSGFEPESTERGAGLQNMADRLEALGGEIEIASSIGHGTTVTGTIPSALGSRASTGDHSSRLS